MLYDTNFVLSFDDSNFVVDMQTLGLYVEIWTPKWYNWCSFQQKPVIYPS